MWGGWTKMLLGDHQTAIDYLQRALRLSPLDPRIFHAQAGLAFAYFFLGNYEEGLKCAADALRHHPNYVGALRVAMACNALSGNIEAAQKLWRQVALLSPSDRVSETRKRAAYGEIKTLRRYRKPIASPECRNEDDAPSRSNPCRRCRRLQPFDERRRGRDP